MPSLTQLDVVHRLNAPTRAAATRRRRMRKALTCVLVVLAALIAFGGRGSATASSSDASGNSSPLGGSSTKVDQAGHTTTAGAPGSALAGRRLVSVPVDATLRDALDARSRVDVWSSTGTRLVRDAPVVLSSAQPARVLVGIRPEELTTWARAAGSSGATGDDMLVTLAP